MCQPQYSHDVGLYTNRTKPIAALGGSIDFNLSKKLGDPAFAGSDPGALWDGDAGVCCDLGWSGLPVREEVGSRVGSWMLVTGCCTNQKAAVRRLLSGPFSFMSR